MARSLILGNSNLVVTLDANALVRDVYFPYVGQENHVQFGSKHRIGVYANSALHWLDESGWDIEVTMESDSLVGQTKACNDDISIGMTFEDAVYNEKNIFVRECKVTNQSDKKQSVVVYFGHEFNIQESRQADTAYFDPRKHALVHYKGRRVFLMSAINSTDNVLFDQYTAGIYGAEGKAGSYKDAEDGKLSSNPVEHGMTDSVFGVSLDMAPGETKTLHYWMCADGFIDEVFALSDYVVKRSPEALIRTTHDYWHAWVTKYNFDFYDLPQPVVDLWRRSLLLMRTHADQGGALIASLDSEMLQGGKDTYAYMWPRDGALSALALDKAGDADVTRRFFSFCNEVISADGYLMHKYLSDKSLGSSWHPWTRNGKLALPIQEDETALVLFALWQHYERSRDLEFIESIYNSFIKKAADFLCGYRDQVTGLPLPSFDLWEENYGVHTFTVSSVYGGLRAAENFARLLGKTEQADHYEETAKEIQIACLDNLYDVHRGVFYKSAQVEDGKIVGRDLTIDASSAYGVYLFGLLDGNDERLIRAMEETRGALTVPGPIGGVCRYEDDNYHRRDDSTNGNAWIITTLWFAQFDISRAQNEEELAKVQQELLWVVDKALQSGILPEQVHPHDGGPVSATPLTWSHGEYVRAVLMYLDKLGELGICATCNPLTIKQV